MIRLRGLYMGREHKGKGVNVALGPVVGPIGRIASGGRNWEGRLTKDLRLVVLETHCP